MKLSALLSLMVFTAFSFVVMLNVKGDVQTMLAQRGDLLAEQTRLREDLHVLKAEFAHLARPQRLNAFARSEGLAELTPGQILTQPRY